jgi:hypothetical protein
MAIVVSKRISELGASFILSPERYDHRRDTGITTSYVLSDLVDILTDNISSNLVNDSAQALVLDTTHAYEGFILIKHDPCSPAQIGSAKRRLLPGDVIVSRLRPYLRQVAYIDERLFTLAPTGNIVCASTEFFVLRSRHEFEVAALVPLLLSPSIQSVLAAGQEGGHHPRFSRDLLASIRVPDEIVSCSNEIGNSVKVRADCIRLAMLEARLASANIESLLVSRD